MLWFIHPLCGHVKSTIGDHVACMDKPADAIRCPNPFNQSPKHWEYYITEENWDDFNYVNGIGDARDREAADPNITFPSYCHDCVAGGTEPLSRHEFKEFLRRSNFREYEYEQDRKAEEQAYLARRRPSAGQKAMQEETGLKGGRMDSGAGSSTVTQASFVDAYMAKQLRKAEQPRKDGGAESEELRSTAAAE